MGWILLWLFRFRFICILRKLQPHPLTIVLHFQSTLDMITCDGSKIKPLLFQVYHESCNANFSWGLQHLHCKKTEENVHRHPTLASSLSSSLLLSLPLQSRRREEERPLERVFTPPLSATYCSLPPTCCLPLVENWRRLLRWKKKSPWWGDFSYFSLWPCWRLRFFLWQWGYSSARRSAMILTSCEQGRNNQTVCSICDDEPDLTSVKTVEIQNETVRDINIVARALIRIRLSKLTYRNQ